MRLINTTTLAFEEFFQPPEYAILSHRWGSDEVTFEQYTSGKIPDGAGHRKVLDCCNLARSRGRGYVWIDTCCIDKRSSAELSESINSMWDWYANARECYAYLADVSPSAPDYDESKPLNANTKRASEWFSRGWTLQELLAPRVVVFCDTTWRIIGKKQDALILSEVSRITSIPTSCLASQFSLSNACVAQKLSWASRRSTTRREDIAYCLLGLLGINMPLLYGEGGKAFLRLQQEIVRQTDDESVFAWRYAAPPVGYRSGILAPGVEFFAHSGSVRLLEAYRDPYVITNKGLDLRVSCVRVEGTDVYLIPLNCQYGGTAETRPLHRCYVAVQEERVSQLFSRVAVEGLGHHLFQLYSKELHQPTTRRFIIRSLRWQNEYEPANAIVQSFVQRLREKKRQKLIERVVESGRRLPVVDSDLVSQA